MTKLTLEPNQVPTHLRGDYQGRRFAVEVTERYNVPIDAGLWSGGSRDLYRAVRLSDGASISFPGQNLFWEGRSEKAGMIPPGVAVVRHSIFQGRDLGLTFYVRPDDAAPMLPEPAPDLSREAQIVLACSVSLISSYRRQAAARQGINANTYDRICERLAEQGLMTPNRAATVKGKNVVASLDRSLVNGL